MRSDSDGRELLILGLLRRNPTSAYFVAKAVRGHAHVYRWLRSGNVYHHLARLEDSGYLRARSDAARRGPAPKRQIYSLSPRGERRFRELLEIIALDPQTPGSVVEIAYVLLGQLTRTDALELLVRRRATILDYQERVQRLLQVEQRVGAALLAGSHAVNRLSAELSWLNTSISQLRRPSWQPQWQQNDGPIEDPTRHL
jgi:DNA-binding PadR family transcriptional regulator